MYWSRLMKRLYVQLTTFIVTNSYIKGFLEGKIFKGKSKYVCVPGLNCYSCPGAIGSCPLGALQAVMGSMKYQISLYIMGLVMLFGTIFGRFICGYLCPFGLYQDLLFKIKTKKYSLPKVLRYVKYFVLIVFVILIPTVFTSQVGIGDPGFCKYICPSGTLMGAIPLLIKNPSLRQALGLLFTWKMGILLIISISAVFVHRSFCRVLCPLGLIYGLFNKVSLLKYEINEDLCTSCGVCKSICTLDLDPVEDVNHIECIRCGECKGICPSHAIERK